MARRLVFAVLLVSALGAWAPAIDAQYFGRNKVQYRTFDFQLLQTEHFDVYHYPEEAEAAVEAFFDSIIKSLRDGEKIELRGFGSFRLRSRGARVGRNPKTGEKVNVPAKRIPYFKPGKELKELINREAEAAEGITASVAPGAAAQF